MRLIDADALYRMFEEVYREPDYSLKDAAWWFFGKLGDAPSIIPPPNDPLTLEELREMDGEPVWVVDGDCGYYALIGCIYETCIWITTRYDWNAQMMFSDYGKTWLVYRRKQEEG